MKSQNFILAFCLLIFTVKGFSQTWPNMVRVNYTTSTNQFIDNIVIRFSNDPGVSTAESFYWDARSLNCCTFIASIKGNFNFAIQTRPLAFNVDTVKLRVASVYAGDFKLVFTEFQNFTKAKSILLIDTYSGTTQDIKAISSYNFTINADAASQGADRFKLVFISEQLVLECPDNIVVNHTFGTNGANVLFSMYAPVAKCSNPFFNFSHLPNSFFPIGNTTVTVDAYDLCGNTASCSFTVTVKDVDPPLVSSPLPLNFSANQGLATYSFIPVAPAATDNHRLTGIVGTRNDGKALDLPYPLGTTTITWKATDSSGNINSVLQFVTVKDDEAPVINAPEMILSIGDGCSASLMNNPVSVTDNSGNVHYTGTRNDGAGMSDPYPAGTTSIIWTATDAAGNTSTAVQKIIVKDEIPPTILPVSNILLVANVVGCKGKIHDTSLDPVAFDNCSIASLTNNFNNTSSLSGAELPQGISNILWTAIDTYGNETSWLQVIETTMPVNQISIPDVVALAGVDANTIYLGFTPASVLSYDAASSGMTNYRWNVSSNLAINGADNTALVNVTATTVSTLPYTLTLNATDAIGCPVSTTKQLRVVDISCGKNRIAVCSPAYRNLCINPNGLTAYLQNGYQLGNCNTSIAKPASTALVMNDERSFKAFPNPGNGLINLQFSNYQNTQVEIRISDILGKLVSSKMMNVSSSIETVKFDLQNKSAGIYNVQVITKDGVKSTKIVIAR